MTTAIIIISHKGGDILPLQIKHYRKFCKDDDFDIVVVDNSNQEEESRAVRFYAKDGGCQYMITKSGDRQPSMNHAFAANMALTKYGDTPFMMFSDHDLFPVKEFRISDYLKDKTCAGLPQYRKCGEKEYHYFWPGLLMLDTGKLKDKELNFYPTKIDNVMLDTGGCFYHTLQSLPDNEYIFFDEVYVDNPGFRKGRYGFYSMMAGETFMHFIGGSNWMGEQEHEDRMNSLKNELKNRSGL